VTRDHRLHLRIAGEVQGVAFRASTVRQARALGLDGWVRNLPDGRVELVAEGDVALLERLLEWCHHGPPAASVSRVEEQWLEHIGDLGTFTIRFD
jgi:acylphosphatase